MNNLSDALENLQNKYREKTKKSKNLTKRFSNVMPGGDTRTATFYSPYPIILADGNEDTIEDIDGNQYIDMLNNYTSLIHGHTVKTNLNVLQDYNFAYCGPTIYQEALAAEICHRVKSVDLVRFTNSGSEATELAVQVARKFTKKRWIIKAEGGYHGTNEIARAGSPGNQVTSESLDNLGVKLVPFNDLEALEKVLKDVSDNCAAVMLEPVMGAAGTILPLESYLQGVESLCKDYNVLFILDEVQMFRLSYGGAQEIWRLNPDLTAFGKIIGGGIPIGAVGGAEHVMSVLNPGNPESLHGSGTFNGNPLSMIMGKYCLDTLTPEAIQAINDRAKYIALTIEKIINRLSLPAQVTLIGSVFNVHWTTSQLTNYRMAQTANTSLKQLFHLAMLLNGVYIAPRGMFNVSTALTKENADFVVKAFENVAYEFHKLISR